MKIKNILIFGVALLGVQAVAGEVNVSFPKVDSEPLLAVPDDGVVLYDGWQMRESVFAGTDGSDISKVGYAADDWYATSVPTTVLGTLIRHGIYPDPYIGTNNMCIPDSSYAFNERYDLAKFSHLPDKKNPWVKPYWFRTEFTVPADFRGKQIWFNLDGINYRADLWLNGRKVADLKKLEGMFKRYRLPVTRFLRPGKVNGVAVLVYPLDYPGDPVHASLDNEQGPNGGDVEILRNVTQYASVGWDWVPAARDRNMGIWQHVSISATGPVKVVDPAAFPDVKMGDAETTADVTVRVFIENPGKQDAEVDLTASIQPIGFEGQSAVIPKKVIVKPGRQEVLLTAKDFPQLVFKIPELWWPNTYGGQPLYALKVTANVSGDKSSEAEGRFGFRKLESFLLKSGGRAYKVNGRVIRTTGGQIVNDYLLSWSAQRYRDEVAMLAGGNATFVRINGCGIMPPDVFFDECDEVGLLVWEDFSRTSAHGYARRNKSQGGWNPEPCHPKTYLNNMKDVISRLRGHTSLALWCGSNEAYPQEDTGVALQNEILPKMDGTRIFLPSSHAQPKWSNIKINTRTGGPWHMVKLKDYYRLYASEKGFEARNEIGLPPGLPINSVAKFQHDFEGPGAGHYPFVTETLHYHDIADLAAPGLKLMRAGMGADSSLGEKLKWWALYSNQAYRTIFEAANKARPRNEGTMLWKSNAAWPSFTNQIYDWYLRPNAGYYTMKEAVKPLHVQYAHSDGSIQIASTLPERLSRLVVKVEVLSLESGKSTLREFTKDVGANQTVEVGGIRDLTMDGGLYFIALDLLDSTGRERDRTVVWTQKEDNWRGLLRLKEAQVGAKVLSVNESDQDEFILSVELTNHSDWPAVNLMAEIVEGSFGQEILPCFWERNALTLMPHETIQTRVRVRKELMVGKVPHLLLEGFNIKPVSMNVNGGPMETVSAHISHLKLEQKDDGALLHFSATQPEAVGDRITTMLVPLKIDGELLRYVSVAVRRSGALTGRITLPKLTKGKHSIQFGNAVLACAGADQHSPFTGTIGNEGE